MTLTMYFQQFKCNEVFFLRVDFLYDCIQVFDFRLSVLQGEKIH
jgi:hypothetical protein